MGFPSVQAEDQSGISRPFGPANIWTGYCLGRLVPGPNLVETLGSGRLAGGAGPGPKVPTMPPFSLPGRKIIPGREKE